jgi:hypothetical protein
VPRWHRKAEVGVLAVQAVFVEQMHAAARSSHICHDFDMLTKRHFNESSHPRELPNVIPHFLNGGFIVGIVWDCQVLLKLILLLVIKTVGPLIYILVLTPVCVWASNFNARRATRTRRIRQGLRSSVGGSLRRCPSYTDIRIMKSVKCRALQ